MERERVKPDGTAKINAHGLTGDSDYAVGHVAKGTLYAYHVEARFEDSRGTGRRVELRPCDYSFVKQ